MPFNLKKVMHKTKNDNIAKKQLKVKCKWHARYLKPGSQIACTSSVVYSGFLIAFDILYYRQTNQ